MKLFIKREILEDLSEAVSNHQQAKKELSLLESSLRAEAENVLLYQAKIESAGRRANMYQVGLNPTIKETEYAQQKQNEELRHVAELEQDISTAEKRIQELPALIEAKRLEVRLGEVFLAGFVAVEVEVIKV
jgi:chromosome segregation ATPase